MCKTLFRIMALGLLLFFQENVFGKVSIVCDVQHDIVIEPSTSEQPDVPRTPSFNPFFAYEDGSSVTLGSVSPYGDVAVTLVSTAGDYYQTVFDTEDGQVIIPISGDAGHYSLTLVTERGLVFEGEFDL